MDWIDLALRIEIGVGLLNAVMNVQVSSNWGNFLIS
jgi:hypothetical protein